MSGIWGDKDLGLHRRIPRRDFLNGIALGGGAGALAPSALLQAFEAATAKRVDASAVDPGNKGIATQHYNENNPLGETCSEGPVIVP